MFVYSASFSLSPPDNALTQCPAALGLQPQRAKFIPAGALFTMWSILPRTRQWPSPGWTVHASPSLAPAVPRPPVWSLERCPIPCTPHVFTLRAACGLLSIWEATRRCGFAWAAACSAWLGSGGQGISHEGVVHPMRNQPGTPTREGMNGAARLMQPHVVLCSLHLALQWSAMGSGCHVPPLVPLMGSQRLGGQSCQELSLLFPVTQLDVTPGLLRFTRPSGGVNIL